jgi:hypothetical protein
MVQVGPTEPAADIQANTTQGAPNEVAQGAIQPKETILQRAQDNPMLPSLLLFGGLLLMVIILFRALRKNTSIRKNRERQAGSPSDRIAEIHSRAQSSMDPGTKLMVDAESVARRLGAQLDNKGARLELLLEEADIKLEKLNRLLAIAERSGSSTEPLAISTPLPTQEPRAPRTLDPTVLDRARIDQDRADRTPTPQHGTNGSAQDQINDRIISLADDGLGCVEIARSLNQPIGQVELVLNLRKSS